VVLLWAFTAAVAGSAVIAYYTRASFPPTPQWLVKSRGRVEGDWRLHCNKSQLRKYEAVGLNPFSHVCRTSSNLQYTQIIYQCEEQLCRKSRNIAYIDHEILPTLNWLISNFGLTCFIYKWQVPTLFKRKVEPDIRFPMVSGPTWLPVFDVSFVVMYIFQSCSEIVLLSKLLPCI